MQQSIRLWNKSKINEIEPDSFLLVRSLWRIAVHGSKRTYYIRNGQHLRLTKHTLWELYVFSASMLLLAPAPQQERSKANSHYVMQSLLIGKKATH